MAVYHYTKATRAALLDQLLASVAGLTAQNTGMVANPTDVWLTVPDAIREPTIAAVVAAHDATALDAAKTQAVTDTATARARAVQNAAPVAGVALTALTAAQTSALLGVLLAKFGALSTIGTIRPPSAWA